MFHDEFVRIDDWKHEPGQAPSTGFSHVIRRSSIISLSSARILDQASGWINIVIMGTERGNSITFRNLSIDDVLRVLTHA